MLVKTNIVCNGISYCSQLVSSRVGARVGARVGRAVLNLVSLSADGAGNSFPVSESVS